LTNNLPETIDQVFVAVQAEEVVAEVVTEGTVFVDGLPKQIVRRHASACNQKECFTNEIRMAAQKAIQWGKLCRTER
jgi:hypothetical protein